MRPILQLEAFNNMLFDGITAACWIVSLHTSVGTARVRNIIPGQLYTVVFMQDQVGGHLFTWPSQFHNAKTVNLTAHAITLQNFIGLAGGDLYANMPGTWYEKGQ
jgi:hypothetical protein